MMGRTRTKVSFWLPENITILRMNDASDAFLFDALEGGKLSDLDPVPYSLSEYDNGEMLVEFRDGSERWFTFIQAANRE